MPTLAVYLHDIDPVAVPIHGDFAIRWYGLSYLLAFFIGYLLIRLIVKRGVSTIKPAEVGDLIVTLAFGIVIGGRLGYCVFYDPRLLAEFSPDFPFWGVLAINRGGMASHGGILGGIVACLYYARRHHHSWAHLLDLFAFGAPLGLFFGRCANFINGELYGRPVESDVPWAVKFPQEIERWFPRGDEASWKPEHLNAISTASEKLGEHEPFDTLNEQIAAIIHAIQQGNAEVARVIEPHLVARHPSQLYEALLEGLLVAIVLLVLWYRPRKPLIVCGAFGLTYALVRILGEMFRLPDEQLGYLFTVPLGFTEWNVTQGQLLSVPLAITAIVLIVIGRRRDVPKMGGWGGTSVEERKTRNEERLGDS